MPEKIFTVPRGLKDIEPDEMAKRLWVNERITEVLRRYGFQMMEPTTLENLRTLEAKSGPTIRDEIYWFKDKAGRSLGLRFDLTVGMTRLVANRYDLPEPIKLAAISGQWRYDEPQFGRYRYFTAWDAEIYGSPEPIADAEAIAVGAAILENLGLKDFVVRISNRRLIQNFLARQGIRSLQRIESVIRIIDKLRRAGPTDVTKQLQRSGLRKKAVDAILDFVSVSGDPGRVLGTISNLGREGKEAARGYLELVGLADCLETFGIKGKCVYDLSIVRGIGYYDGIVFEAYDRGGEDIGAIFGGGRYDKLCRIYGKRDMPATGLAGGIERTLLSLERAGAFPKLMQRATVFVVAVNDEARPEAQRVTVRLRESGVASDLDLKSRPLGKQLEYANSLGIPFTIILGPEEIRKGVVKLRDMAAGSESEISIEDSIRRLKAWQESS